MLEKPCPLPFYLQHKTCSGLGVVNFPVPSSSQLQVLRGSSQTNKSLTLLLTSTSFLTLSLYQSPWYFLHLVLESGKDFPAGLAWVGPSFVRFLSHFIFYLPFISQIASLYPFVVWAANLFFFLSPSPASRSQEGYLCYF